MAIPFEASFASRLRCRDTVVGSVLTLPSVVLAELSAEGLDFVWIDLEHGSLGAADVAPLAVAARAARCAAVARLPSADDIRLSTVLDAGVDGVVAPRVESAAEARRLVERLRHPPRGTRGYAARRAVGYGRTADRAAAADVGASASDPVLMAQIETAAGVRAAAEIAAVDGVDALVVGCADLALALAGELNARSEPVRNAIARIQLAAADEGIASGIAGPDDPRLLGELGNGRSTVFVCSADVRTYASAAGDRVAELRRVLAASAPGSEAARVAT